MRRTLCYGSLIVFMVASCSAPGITNSPLPSASGDVPALAYEATARVGEILKYTWPVCAGEIWRFAFNWRRINEEDSTEWVSVGFVLPEASKTYDRQLTPGTVEGGEVPVERDGQLVLHVETSYQPHTILLGWDILGGDRKRAGCELMRLMPTGKDKLVALGGADTHLDKDKGSHLRAELQWTEPVDLDLSANWPEHGFYLGWRQPILGRSRLTRDVNTPCLAAQHGNTEAIDWYLLSDDLKRQSDNLHFNVHFFSRCNRDIETVKYTLTFTLDGDQSPYVKSAEIALDETIGFSLGQIVNSRPDEGEH